MKLEPRQVVIVTDTLATLPSGESHLLVTKCTAVPHLDLVVAFTGIAQLGHRWAHRLQTATLARNIDLLDHLVAPSLREINAGLNEEFGEPPGTSTVYHFGFSEDRQEYVGYAYRSENDFASELMEPSFRVKPQPMGDITTPNELDELVQLGIRLRSEQEALPSGSRVYIGGDLIMTVLSDRAIYVSRVFRFDDFEEQWLVMNRNLQ